MRPGVAKTRLIGRDLETGQLRVSLDALLDGGVGRAVLVGGEAGVGKTRLLDDLEEQARTAGVVIGRATGHEDFGVPPFFLWHQLLRHDQADPLGGLRDDGRDRALVFDAVVDVLADTSAPRMLVIDDAHWVDAPSLELLRYLFRELHRTRTLVVVAFRTSELGPATPWRTVHPFLARERIVDQLDLAGLPIDDTATLFESMSGCAPGEDLIAEVQRLTAGNPFYVRELARNYQRTARLDPSSTVVGAIGTRLARLSAATSSLISSAAVLGEAFAVALLARVVGSTVLATHAQLDEARSAGLLDEHDVPGMWRFTHALVRDAVLAGLGADSRVEIHRRAADVLAAAIPHGKVSVAEIARHRIAGAVDGHDDEALEWATHAGREAMHSLAFEDAAWWFLLALRCAGPDTPPATKAALHLARAHALWRAADRAGCDEAVRHAIEEGRSAGRADLVAEAALVEEPIGALAWDLPLSQRCEDALAGLGTSDDVLRARLLARRAETHLYLGEYDAAASGSAAALALADETGDTTAVVAGLRARQLSLAGPEHNEARSALAARMITAGVTLRRPDIEQWARLWRIDTHWERGDVGAVVGDVPRLRWCVEHVGGPTARWHLLVIEAATAAAQARFDEAMTHGRAAFELGRDVGTTSAFGAYMNLLGMIGHHIGHDAAMASAPVGADGDVAVDEGELRDAIFSYVGPAVVLAESGRLDEAAEVYRLAGPPQQWDPPPYFRVTAWANAVLVAVAIDKRAELEFLRDRLAAERGRSSVAGAGTAAYGGIVELYLGKAAAALGDLDAAVRDFEHARSHEAAVGAVGFQAEASIELAAALLRRAGDGDLERANVVLADGETIASRCGMTPWAARAASLRAALSDRPAGPLSRREVEVAELVGQGMTNRQIARDLYISERTAQTHVQHILTKLGFSTRSQIAAWITAQRELTS